MSTPTGSCTPRDTNTPPPWFATSTTQHPFTSSTTQNSAAWFAAGAPVNFTQEIEEQASSEVDSSRVSSKQISNSRDSFHNEDVRRSRSSLQNCNESLHTTQAKPRHHSQISRKAVDYAAHDHSSNVYTPTTSFVEDRVIPQPCGPAVVLEYFILKNALITNSNPRGPKKRRWTALVRKHWWWFVPLNIFFATVFTVYFIYQDQIAEGTEGIRKWLDERAAWSWSIPTALLIVLACPPFFLIPLLSELIQFIVGLSYPLWIGIAIASLSTIVGDGALFLIFKYAASEWVRKRCDKRPNWAAIARVSEESGLRGVLMIRFSVVPPSLANPIFATTGMSLWLYMATIILSLPKQIVLVILGYPATQDDKGAIAAKVLSISGFVIVTIWGTVWLRGQLRLAKDAIRAERNSDLSAEIRKQVALADQQQKEQRFGRC